jgi:hypothetical protein
MNAREKIAQLVKESRRQIGNAPLTATAEKLNRWLRQGGFNYLVVGGYAVQEHGYARFTNDVDIVVDDRDRVRHFLLATGKFKAVPGSAMSIKDADNGVLVDLLPAGSVDSRDALPYPEPRSSTGHMIQFVTMPELLNLKLSAYRMKDRADVTELIKRQLLSHDFYAQLHPKVQERYRLLWGEAQAELDRSSS